MRDCLGKASDPSASREERLAALEKAVAREASRPEPRGEVNNHIHTIYSFSPYTPAMAAYGARAAGLEAAGSVDHDSVGAAREMRRACAILGIGSCSGFELRVNFDGTRFQGYKLNNPDTENLNYMTVQGIRGSALHEAEAFLSPLRAARNERNKRQTEAASRELDGLGIGKIDFEDDVLPLSKFTEGGSVTERHILAAVARAVVRKAGRGEALVSFLGKNLGLKVPAQAAAWLSDPRNPHELFDILGVLKSEFLPRIFVKPGREECINVREAVAFAKKIDAVPAYAYLGDVGESPTGDKKAEKFEDGCLDELIPELKRIGFLAVAYMPPRNSVAQLSRLSGLCVREGLFEISGVDINSSRQSFSSPEVLRPEYRHLVDTTWALVAHEKLVELDMNFGFFSENSPAAGKSLKERVALYADIGRTMDRGRTDASEKEVRILKGR